MSPLPPDESTSSSADNANKDAAESPRLNITIVFCSGGWHTKAHVEPVIPLFAAKGYRVIPCPLPSAGKKGVTDADTIAAIRDTISSALDADVNGVVAVILHSAAGMQGVAAVNQILLQQQHSKSGTAKVALTKRLKLLFLASFLSYAPVVERLTSKNHISFSAEEGIATVLNAQQLFYNDAHPRETAEPFLDALTFNSIMTEPDIRSDLGWKACEMWHIVCESDEVVPVEWQVRMAREEGMEVVWGRGWGHVPFVTRTGEFVEVIEEGVLRGMRVRDDVRYGHVAG